MKILGISGVLGHDASAALVVDGKVIAAAEEERFIRDKHAKNKFPVEATKFCLKAAGINPNEIDIVTFPYAKIPFFSKARWHYAKRYWYAPDRALDAILNGNRRFRRNLSKAKYLMETLGINNANVIPVEHHLSHASSAYHLSGFKEKTAIVGIDGKGEYATTFFGYGENGIIHKVKEFYDPESLGGLYGAITEFLGFDMLDGEFKVMGMAPYGNPDLYDFSNLVSFKNGELKINTSLVNVIGFRRYKEDGKGYYFSPKFVDLYGPKRDGDKIDDPYIHYAAAIQKKLEEIALEMIEYYLGDIIRETGKICMAGGVALNVKLNQRIINLPHVKELFVQPASGDSGTSLGAATFISSIHDSVNKIEKMEHVYYGPEFSSKECEDACKKHPAKPKYTKVDDQAKVGAEILAAGNPLAWFQGKMEFGPRALGSRSILGDPTTPKISDKINEQIKYRERWRPFCPSVLDIDAESIIGSKHPSPFMTFTFNVQPKWIKKIPEVVHEDKTIRVQVVSKKTNKVYYQLLENFKELKGVPVVLNTSLNRRGEPMVCSPEDALNMFYGCDLEYMLMENILVTK
jgi:carbamoyltransferase